MLVLYPYFLDADAVPVALKGNNGKYLTFHYPSYVMFITSTTFDSTRFYASAQHQKLSLKAAKNGKILCRVDGSDQIRAYKNVPDQYCLFTVHNQADGIVVLQADNEKYLSRVNRGIGNLEAAKSSIDDSCKLRLQFQFQAK